MGCVRAVQLKMSVNRLRLMQQKQTALAKQARRELAQLLDQGKEESARIRVENIIREDLFVEMLEILELYCELLLARFGLLEQMYSPLKFIFHDRNRKECDPGLEEAVKTIIYAAPRSESKELQEVRCLPPTPLDMCMQLSAAGAQPAHHAVRPPFRPNRHRQLG
jgi:vacuolar protein sorting-associated protein IST1